jgi:hypothetical protein
MRGNFGLDGLDESLVALVNGLTRGIGLARARPETERTEQGWRCKIYLGGELFLLLVLVRHVEVICL